MVNSLLDILWVAPTYHQQIFSLVFIVSLFCLIIFLWYNPKFFQWWFYAVIAGLIINDFIQGVFFEPRKSYSFQAMVAAQFPTLWPIFDLLFRLCFLLLSIYRVTMHFKNKESTSQ